MVTTLGAAFAAAAVAVVAFCGSLMTTFCAAALAVGVLCAGSTSATTPAPAPPPITAPATRPAMPTRRPPGPRGAAGRRVAVVRGHGEAVPRRLLRRLLVRLLRLARGGLLAVLGGCGRLAVL